MLRPGQDPRENEDDEEDEDAAEESGELYGLDPDDDEVVDTDDGGALVTVGGREAPGERAHFDNLVDNFSELFLTNLGNDLDRLVALDKESRQPRDEQYTEGIQRTGLGREAPGGASFEGASKVVHPMLIEACVDFAARAMKEIFPAKGPAKAFIPGEPTKEKTAQATRKVRHLNWQLTTQMVGFRENLEQTLTQVPLAGAHYIKPCWDESKRRPTAVSIPIDDLLIPFAADSFASAERKTHRQHLTEQEYQRRVASKMYRDLDLAVSTELPEQTDAAKASDKVEGKQATGENPDGLRDVDETACWFDLESAADDASHPGDGDPQPYLISRDVLTKKVLSIYRNWKEDDPQREELIWIVEFPFIPWRGAFPIGMAQMIGSLSGSATGALRSLLDAGLINNFPGLLKLKGGSKGGQSKRIQPMGIEEIEGAFMTDDIRKTMMPMPFNPPSTTLFQLLGFLVDTGKGVVRTTFEDLTNGAHKDLPVGTTLAIIEQGMVVFSSIHSRLHASMQRLLDVLSRINHMYQDDEELKDEAGEILAKRSDYSVGSGVVPVSDPNIFSETQRFAQSQAVVARSDAHPELYDARKVEELFLERLKIPDYKSLLAKSYEPKPMNAVNENLAAAAQRPLAAFPDQDHLAHLEVHLSFLASPFFGSSILFAKTFIPTMLTHVREHLAFWYASSIYQVVQESTGEAPESLMDKNPLVSSDFDKLLAAASQRVLPIAPQVFKDLPPIIQRALQLVQQLSPPAPQDPTVAAAQAAQAETNRKAQADQLAAKDKAETRAATAQEKAAERQARLQEKALEIQQRAKDTAARLSQAAQEAELRYQQAQAQLAQETELAQLREVAETARGEADIAARLSMNTSDNQTAMLLAQMEIESGERVAVSTGTGINPGA